MKAAMDFLAQKSGSYHFSPNFVLLGASAGGHLALLQGYKYNQPKVKAVVDFFGPVDMVGMYNSAANPLTQQGILLLMNGSPTTNPTLYQQSSPINFVTAQSPPTIILHGDGDIIVNLSQSVALKNKLQSVGVTNQLVVYPGQGHELWPTPVMNDAFDKVVAFIQANVQ